MQRRMQAGSPVRGVPGPHAHRRAHRRRAARPRSLPLLALTLASLLAAAPAWAQAQAGRLPAPAGRPASTTAGAPLALEVFTGSAQAFHVTSTLIAGRKEAILVDAQFLASDATKLADRIASRGVRLKAIVVTHPHPDHYFGAAVLHARFPDAPIYMTPATLAEVTRTQAAKIAFWTPILGAAEMPAALPEAQTLPALGLTVEGQAIDIVTDLQGDVLTRSNSFVWVPSLRAVIAGDLVYHQTHVWLAESTPQTRGAWLASLRRLAALAPRRVVAGHKKQPDLADTPDAVTFTTAYIRDFDAARAAAVDAPALAAAMTQKHPDLGFPNILDLAVKAAYAARP